MIHNNSHFGAARFAGIHPISKEAAAKALALYSADFPDNTRCHNAYADALPPGTPQEDVEAVRSGDFCGPLDGKIYTGDDKDFYRAIERQRNHIEP